MRWNPIWSQRHSPLRKLSDQPFIQLVSDFENIKSFLSSNVASPDPPTGEKLLSKSWRHSEEEEYKPAFISGYKFGPAKKWCDMIEELSVSVFIFIVTLMGPTYENAVDIAPSHKKLPYILRQPRWRRVWMLSKPSSSQSSLPVSVGDLLVRA